METTRAAAFVAALGLALLLQRVSPHAKLRGNWRLNGMLALVNAGMTAAICGGCLFAAADWATQRGIGLLQWTSAAPWASVIAAIVLLDLASYAWHRANHAVPALWRFHQVHHSDERFTVSTALRFHPGEVALSLPVRLSAIVILGAPAEAVLAFEGVFAIANLVEHGDIDVSRRVERALGLAVITPAMHRRHHTKLGRARDSNFGTIFSLWDRVLGTHTPAASSDVVATGLPGLEATSMAEALCLPARRA